MLLWLVHSYIVVIHYHYNFIFSCELSCKLDIIFQVSMEENPSETMVTKLYKTALFILNLLVFLKKSKKRPRLRSGISGTIISIDFG